MTFSLHKQRPIWREVLGLGCFNGPNETHLARIFYLKNPTSLLNPVILRSRSIRSIAIAPASRLFSSSEMAASVALRNPNSRRLVGLSPSYYHSCCRAVGCGLESPQSLLPGTSERKALDYGSWWRRSMATFTRTYDLSSMLQKKIFLLSLFL